MKRIFLFFASFSLFLLFSDAASAQQGDWVQFGRYASDNAALAGDTGHKAPKAVFIGDSITDGWDGKDPEFFSGNDFVCRGISGQCSSQMLVRFRQDVLNLHPKYVVILAGTNDLARNNYNVSPENVLDNIISMCELARAAHIRPILCSVTPAAAFGWRKEVNNVAEKIISLNRMIKSYADSARIPYVDYHSVLKDGNGGMPEKFSGDGVHPNAECYEIMESTVLPYLK